MNKMRLSSFYIAFLWLDCSDHRLCHAVESSSSSPSTPFPPLSLAETSRRLFHDGLRSINVPSSLEKESSSSSFSATTTNDSYHSATGSLSNDQALYSTLPGDDKMGATKGYDFGSLPLAKAQLPSWILPCSACAWSSSSMQSQWNTFPIASPMPTTPFPHDQLRKHSAPLPVKKTGTTIVGVCGADYCILGADTRATSSNGGSGSLLVADTRATKLHWLTQTAVAAGAGTSADLQHLTRLAAFSLALYEKTGYGEVGNAPVDSNNGNNRSSRHAVATKGDKHKNDKSSRPIPRHLAQNVAVGTVVQWLQRVLFQAQGQIQAYLIVAGLDSQSRPRLFSLYPHGSVDRGVAYTALGSGGYHAMSILEDRYRPDMTVTQAQQLVRQALAAGIANDLGSGSQMDICVISADGRVDYQRCETSEIPHEKEKSSPRLSERAGVNGFGDVPIVSQGGTTAKRTVKPDGKVNEGPWSDALKAFWSYSICD